MDQFEAASKIARREGLFWGDEVTIPYFEIAEKHMEQHWEQIIRPFIDDIPYDTVVDLASGHGRNAVLLGKKATLVYCVDINPDNVHFLRKRFALAPKYVVIQNDGSSLPSIADDHVDLFYCFDALVHFDLEIIQCYLKEARRITRIGGHAFIHCSNYTGNPGGDFRDNPHWRNFMSREIFTHLAKRAGFTVARVETIAWGGIRHLDCVFLLRKD